MTLDKADLLRSDPAVAEGKVMSASTEAKLETLRRKAVEADRRGRTKAARSYRKQANELAERWPELQRQGVGEGL